MWWIALSLRAGVPGPQPHTPWPPEAAAVPAPVPPPRAPGEVGAAPGGAPLAAPDPLSLLQDLACWALQFSPRVCVQAPAVLIEAEACTRLFGGRRRLLQRVQDEGAQWCAAQGLGPPALACAPTALAALALLRAGASRRACSPQSLRAVLDALPLQALAATEPHLTTLLQTGCQSLGQLRRLPRDGVARRFGCGLLQALDQAYGLQAASHAWLQLPERFCRRLAFEGRIEQAEGLLFVARRLLLQLRDWLAARQSGVLEMLFLWEHGMQRASDQRTGSLQIKTVQPTRDVAHLLKLLAEHLARQSLVAPVEALRLEATLVQPLPLHSASLLPSTQGPGADGSSLGQLIDRLSARLGAQRVLAGQLQADHRPERMQRWHAAAQPVSSPAQAPDVSQRLHPPWLLRVPQRLRSVQDQPHYQGRLQLLAGPERLEAGWWYDAGDQSDQAQGPHHGLPVPVVRDYFIAHSPGAGLVWVFRAGPCQGHSGQATLADWWLHGFYG